MRGVVAREMPASWSMEALKAQSVAARTFGSRYLGSTTLLRHLRHGLVPGLRRRTPTRPAHQRRDRRHEGQDPDLPGRAGADAVLELVGRLHERGLDALPQGRQRPVGRLGGQQEPRLDPDGHRLRRSRRSTAIGTLKSITVTRRNGHGDQGGRVVSMTLKGSKASTHDHRRRRPLGLRSEVGLVRLLRVRQWDDRPMLSARLWITIVTATLANASPSASPRGSSTASR